MEEGCKMVIAKVNFSILPFVISSSSSSLSTSILSFASLVGSSLEFYA